MGEIVEVSWGVTWFVTSRVVDLLLLLMKVLFIVTSFLDFLKVFCAKLMGGLIFLNKYYFNFFFVNSCSFDDPWILKLYKLFFFWVGPSLCSCFSAILFSSMSMKLNVFNACPMVRVSSVAAVPSFSFTSSVFLLESIVSMNYVAREFIL